ncbi:uncharacterized protein BX664DRAFT_299587 [Halteromyces radiatus]|uniref:uncharacterized protein n=1 Tax=Halteromyces radiatus TaxID=101107 RepID=UPI0022200ABA|nr:uncharacterized protein BX664DRAFT_299587 [Halteromyces radiatus]KAI8086719.1 hypothetical protein BX664DRAFT_299587 [Halteromyces radiatus]
MSHQLPWNEDTRMNLSDFLQKSMSFASAIMENQQSQSQAAKHLGSLLQLQQQRQQPEDHGRSATIFNQLFTTAEQSMESDNDKRVLGLLKSQLATFISTTLGMDGFEEATQQDPIEEEENHAGLSWADVTSMSTPRPSRLDDDDDDEDIGYAERAEQNHLKQLASDYNSYDKEDDEPDSEEEEEEEEGQVKSRGVVTRSADGFQTVQKKKRYRRNQYRRQPVDNYQEFNPDPLEPLSPDVYCIPIFFPSEESYDIFHGALSTAQSTLHVAVFSLTDNKTANVLIDAKERGVDVKIVTDNDQLDGKGADVRRLNQDYGIPFKTDTSEQFMHNKFAVIDGKIVITGSFNWSIGARFKNRENVIVTNIPSLAEAYEKEFEKLWEILEYE